MDILGDIDVDVDTLLLRAVGSARRHRIVHRNGVTRLDTTANFDQWRVVVDSTTHAAMLCLEGAGVGDSECNAIRYSLDSATIRWPVEGRAHYVRKSRF